MPDSKVSKTKIFLTKNLNDQQVLHDFLYLSF